MRDGGEGRGGEGKRYSKYGSTLPLFSLPLRLSFASHPRLCANGSKRSLLSHNELTEEPKKDPAPFVFLLHSSSFFYLRDPAVVSQFGLSALYCFPQLCAIYQSIAACHYTQLSSRYSRADVRPSSLRQSDGTTASEADSRFSTLSQSGSERAMTSAADRRLF